MQARIFLIVATEVETQQDHFLTCLSYENALDIYDQYNAEGKYNLTGIRPAIILDAQEWFTDDAPLEDMVPEGKVLRFKK